MRTAIRMRHGDDESNERRVVMVDGVPPDANTIIANEGETLGSISMRAYGSNTPTTRMKISNANAILKGRLRIPK